MFMCVSIQFIGSFFIQMVRTHTEEREKGSFPLSLGNNLHHELAINYIVYD